MRWNVAFVLFMICFSVSAFDVNTVLADVPVVNGILVWTKSSDNHTILNITLTHHNYFSGHHVNWVRVNVGGTINQLDLSEPQPDSTFTVQYDLGLVSGTPTAQAMVNCNTHGSSAWSETVTVPEFSVVRALFLLITLASVVLIAQKKNRIR